MTALKPLFVENASPEAIRAELKKARANRARWDRRAEQLEELLDQRLKQKAAGEWPPSPAVEPALAPAPEPAGLPDMTPRGWEGATAECSFGRHTAPLHDSGLIGRHRMGEGWLNACPGGGRAPREAASGQ